MSEEDDVLKDIERDDLVQAIRNELEVAEPNASSDALDQAAEAAADAVSHVPLADRVTQAVQNALSDFAHGLSVEGAEHIVGEVVENAIKAAADLSGAELATELAADLAGPLGQVVGDVAGGAIDAGVLDLIRNQIEIEVHSYEHEQNDQQFHDVVEEFIDRHADELPADQREDLIARGVDLVGDSGDVASLFALLDGTTQEDLSPEELSREYVETYFPNASEEEKAALVADGVGLFGDADQEATETDSATDEGTEAGYQAEFESSGSGESLAEGILTDETAEGEGVDETSSIFEAAGDASLDDESGMDDAEQPVPGDVLDESYGEELPESPEDWAAQAEAEVEEQLATLGGSDEHDELAETLEDVEGELAEGLDETIDGELNDGLADAEVSELGEVGSEIASELDMLGQLEEAMGDLEQGFDEPLEDLNSPDLETFTEFEQDLPETDFQELDVPEADYGEMTEDTGTYYEEPPTYDDSSYDNGGDDDGGW